MRNSKGQFVKGSGFWTGKKRPGFRNKTTFIKGQAPWNKGKTFSVEVRRKMSEAAKGKPKPHKRGSKSHFWKGGLTNLRQRLHQSFIYKVWRSSVFKRDNYTCKLCGQRGGKLEADHIEPFSYLVKKYQIKTIEDAINCPELWFINNGRTLCKKCHQKTDTYARKALNYKVINIQLWS